MMIIEFTVKGTAYYAEVEGDTMRIHAEGSNAPLPQLDPLYADDLYGLYSGWDAAKFNRLRGAARDAYKRAHLQAHAVYAVEALEYS